MSADTANHGTCNRSGGYQTRAASLTRARQTPSTAIYANTAVGSNMLADQCGLVQSMIVTLRREH